MVESRSFDSRASLIRFSQHAELKFDILRSQGFDIARDDVIHTVSHPTGVFEGYAGRRVAQAPLDENRVLRVVYEENDGGLLIITFYPGRKARYEQDPL